MTDQPEPRKLVDILPEALADMAARELSAAESNTEQFLELLFDALNELVEFGSPMHDSDTPLAELALVLTGVERGDDFITVFTNIDNTVIQLSVELPDWRHHEFLG